MQSPYKTRSSVLGKRSHQASSMPLPSDTHHDLPTPEQTPMPKKRARVSIPVLDNDSNKENIPPFRVESVVESPLTSRAARALRRASTEMITPPRSRTSQSIILLSSPSL